MPCLTWRKTLKMPTRWPTCIHTIILQVFVRFMRLARKVRRLLPVHRPVVVDMTPAIIRVSLPAVRRAAAGVGSARRSCRVADRVSSPVKVVWTIRSAIRISPVTGLSWRPSAVPLTVLALVAAASPSTAMPVLAFHPGLQSIGLVGFCRYVGTGPKAPDVGYADSDFQPPELATPVEGRATRTRRSGRSGQTGHFEVNGTCARRSGRNRKGHRQCPGRYRRAPGGL